MKVVSKPRLLFRPDPVLGWSLTPGHGVDVKFRPGVVQTIGADGWRRVPGVPKAAGHQVAVYGCSFTYGTGLTDDEAYVALLQKALPDTRMRNRGIGGHSTLQNLLQFRRDIALGQVDVAVFSIISDHRFRNIPHPHRMKRFQNPDWYRLGVEHVPIIRQGRGNTFAIDYVPIWQPAMQRMDFGSFLPDEHMIDTATLRVLQEVQTVAGAADIPLWFALLDREDPAFNETVKTAFPRTTDISVPLDTEFSFKPRDTHPNEAANRQFAERLQPIISGLLAENPRGLS